MPGRSDRLGTGSGWQIDQPAGEGDYLGSYADYATALHDRDDDVIGPLGDVDAALMLACHRIIGPGWPEHRPPGS